MGLPASSVKVHFAAILAFHIGIESKPVFPDALSEWFLKSIFKLWPAVVPPYPQ